MNDQEIYQLVKMFKDATVSARDAGQFQNDSRVKQPTPEFYYPENEYVQIVGKYGIESDGPIEHTRYKARDLTYGLVIDITADQFGEPSVYVCSRNDFYRKFKFDFAHACNGVDNYRLRNLYDKIVAFLPTQ